MAECGDRENIGEYRAAQGPGLSARRARAGCPRAPCLFILGSRLHAQAHRRSGKSCPVVILCLTTGVAFPPEFAPLLPSPFQV